MGLVTLAILLLLDSIPEEAAQDPLDQVLQPEVALEQHLLDEVFHGFS
jgi:hypothetical protein